MRLSDPVKYKARRRLVMGLKEVLKGVKAKKVTIPFFVHAAATDGHCGHSSAIFRGLYGGRLGVSTQPNIWKSGAVEIATPESVAIFLLV